MKLMKMKRLLLSGMVAALVLGLCAVPAAANGIVAVSINAPCCVPEGSSFTATVDITHVTDYSSGVFEVTYDETVLQLTNVTNGELVDGGTTSILYTDWEWVPSGEVDSGRIMVVSDPTPPTGPPISSVSGAGYLAELHFTVIGTWCSESAIGLLNGMLLEFDMSEITATWTDATVKVCPDYDVDCNGSINILDMSLISNHWGETGDSGWICEDVDNNGVINILDMSIVSNHWGETC